MNETHDARLRSWIDSANTPSSDFPIQNLPFGVFRPRGGRNEARIGVAIGDEILDLVRCREEGRLTGLPEALQEACGRTILNPLMALGSLSGTLRRRLV